MKPPLSARFAPWFALVAAVCAVLSAAAEPPPLIPLRDFFRNPEKSHFELSPDGRLFAFLAPWENRLNVFVQKVDGNLKEPPVRVTDSKERDITEYLWVNNDRLAYLLDKGGDENFHLHAVDADGANKKELTPFDKTRTEIIDDLHDLADNHGEILIGTNQRDPQVFDVYRVNTLTGELKMIVENPGNIDHWIADHEGRVRAATATDGVNTSVLYRATEADPFKVILNTNFKTQVAIEMFTYDNKDLYALSNLGRDRLALVRYDPVAAKEAEVIYENPEVDVGSMIVSDRQKRLTGASYETDKPHRQFFDAGRRQLQEDLDRRLPGYEADIRSNSRDENRMLVRAWNDRTSGTYYFYDRAKGDFHKLVDSSPWLKEDQLADMKPIAYTSRDGLTIHGYLTLPRGVEAKNLPVVVVPHGGPCARDRWEFVPDVQFLANRGYAVLQMNFRGSTGYGRKFWEISFKQWGQTMQNDITDGVKWLIGQGIADPKRVGIYGASYGGYAVLAGLTYTPDLYACGVDYVGVSNLFDILKTLPVYWEVGRQQFYEMMGNPDKDKEMMEAYSPFFHVDKIKAPLFIAQGANDPRVRKDESDQMVAALKKRGIDVPYMVKDNEGHGFQNEENRIDFYTAMEKFLAKYLGGRS